MRSFFLPFLLLLFPSTLAVQFTNPQSDGPFTDTTDFSTNPVYTEGDFMIVQWTSVENPDEFRISITMWQINGTHGFIGTSEYITQNATPDTLSASWTVNTAKDLTVSNMFFFNLFFEGQTRSTANSHYFNITAKSNLPPTSSATASISASASTSPKTSSSSKSSKTSSFTTIASPSSTNLAALSPSASAIASTAPPAGSFGTAAKVGIAIGVITAVVLGLAAGWFIFGRQKKQDLQASISTHSLVAVHAQAPWQDKLGLVEERYQLGSESKVKSMLYELPSGRQ